MRVSFVNLFHKRHGPEPNGDIYVMNADGTEETRVTTSGARDLLPDW